MYDQEQEQLNIFDYSQKRVLHQKEPEGANHDQRVQNITQKLYPYSKTMSTGATNCSRSCFIEQELNLTRHQMTAFTQGLEQTLSHSRSSSAQRFADKRMINKWKNASQHRAESNISSQTLPQRPRSANLYQNGTIVMSQRKEFSQNLKQIAKQIQQRNVQFDQQDTLLILTLSGRNSSVDGGRESLPSKFVKSVNSSQQYYVDLQNAEDPHLPKITAALKRQSREIASIKQEIGTKTDQKAKLVGRIEKLKANIKVAYDATKEAKAGQQKYDMITQDHKAVTAKLRHERNQLALGKEIEKKALKAAKDAIKDNSVKETKLKRELQRIETLKQNIALLNHQNKVVQDQKDELQKEILKGRHKLQHLEQSIRDLKQNKKIFYRTARAGIIGPVEVGDKYEEQREELKGLGRLK